MVVAPAERGDRRVSCLLRVAFRRPGGAATATAAGGVPNPRAITLITLLPEDARARGGDAAGAKPFQVTCTCVP